MASPKSLCWLTRTCVVVLLMATVPAWGDAPVDLSVRQVSADQVQVTYQIEPPILETLDIDGTKCTVPVLGKEGRILNAGAPDVPHVCRSVIIPDVGTPGLKVVDAIYYEVPDAVVAPSKGNLLRTQDPTAVPFKFGPSYQQDAFYPGTLASLGEPYILRDYRGVVIALNPIQYNPVTRVLRVYTDVTVSVTTDGSRGINELDRSTRSSKIDSSFRTVYGHQFINHDQAQMRYNPLDETGSMLIICHDAWLPNVQPLVAHKTARGIPTTAVGVSTIGNNSTAIKTYIQNLYNSSDLAFVLLVGDSAQVATPTASGGSSDPTYSKLAGGDNYPDIIVGRFSAETAAQVDTQVLRTIEYETNAAPTQDWFWRGVGIASSQGAGQGDEGQADYVHIGEIRTWLLAFGYTLVNEIYDTNGGTAAMVTTALNNGRGIVNYCGHGSTTSWSTTGFSSTNVAALTNDNMLPFICSVACVNGQFAGTTCFAEAWLRSTHAGEPIGAIAVYMSSVNQSWAPPMEGQDEFNLLLCAEAYGSYGALCFAGSCSMMDDYGAAGVEMFDTWHIFGDPSLGISVTCVDAGTVALDKPKYACQDSVNVLVTDCGLNLDDNVIDTATITVASTTEPAGETVVVTELGPATGQFAGTLPLSATNAPGVLMVAENDTITATYIDADDGQGHYNVTVNTTAVVDCRGPAIADVHVTDLQPRTAVVNFTTNEPARGIVHYGLSCDALNYTAEGTGFSMNPVVALSALQDGTTYFYSVEAVDEAGNGTADPDCYTFTTPEVPDFFTELFTSGNDLDNLTLSFAPNGSDDFYLACAEAISALPTDPAGGTNVTLTDDSYATVNLGGGAQVKLYGASYGTIYIGSNGYITLDHGESGYTETLTSHFATPRVAALYDDLNPSQGGTVSWRQLSDHVAVTWLNVPEHSAANQNTFQIELFFDGRITINFLTIAAADGLAGLSRGLGLDPDFLMSDLSALGPCQTFPPTASNVTTSGDSGMITGITLAAQDDGMPMPPGEMTFVITSLPAHGSLTDPAAGAIAAVPYTLANHGRIVRYQSVAYFTGADSFQFMANDGGTPPDGGDSNVATVTVNVVAVPQQLYSFPMNADPGWSRAGQWAFGQPLGGGTHNKDPLAGHTGTNVLGYNLAGDYADNMSSEASVTTTAINCSDATLVQLRFWRWLGVENFDQARVYVSNNGTTWTQIWQNPGVPISDSSWMPCQFDISAVADHQATVYIRWSIGPTDESVSYPGWNIDDVEIWGWAPPTAPPVCRGDCNCDRSVGFADIDLFVAAIPNNQANWLAKYQQFYGATPPAGCWTNCDVNGNGNVGFDDIDLFVSKIPSACPN